MSGRFPADDLLRALLETAGPIRRSPIGGRTRNRLERVRAGNASWALKTYSRSADRHFAHRFRREEKILTHLAAAEPGLAPAPAGGVIVADNACLLMEDLGAASVDLHNLLDAGSAVRESVVRALAVLGRWHQFTARFHDLLSAYCQSIVLDRNDRATLAKRHRVAMERTGTALAPAAANTLAERVIDPLLQRPFRVIHNSANALNFVARPDGSLALIDFETISLGPLEFDLAELAVHPQVFGRFGLGGLAALYPGGGHEIDVAALARAGLLRAIDISGALAGQAVGEADPGSASALERRSRHYRAVARQIAADLGIGAGVPSAP